MYLLVISLEGSWCTLFILPVVKILGPLRSLLFVLQHELEYGGDDGAMSPRYQAPNQHPPHSTIHSTNSNVHTPSGSLGQATVGHGSRAGHIDQAKNSFFSNALSSPIRRSLQSYHLSQGSEGYPDGASPAENGSRNPESNSFNQTKDPGSNDSSMDMHSDSPAHDSYWVKLS